MNDINGYTENETENNGGTEYYFTAIIHKEAIP